MSVERAHSVRPYNCYRKARRHLRHWASATLHKFRRQVVAREAERQRVLTNKAKDGGTLSGYLLLCESHRRRVRSAKVG